MFLTQPQSRHYRPAKFEGLPLIDNHFDWELFYRFKDERERFWLKQMETDEGFRFLVESHFARFQDSIDRTIGFLGVVSEPRVLDVGLSSEQLDRSLMTRMSASVVILDVQKEAARAYESVYGGKGSFVLGDAISFAAEPGNAGTFDLVYSVGLIEHFPDKREILDAHVVLTKPGGIVLIYVPIDSPDNRKLMSLAAEWENFGYRELLTPDELRDACADARLEFLASESVGFFTALWARKRNSGRPSA